MKKTIPLLSLFILIILLAVGVSTKNAHAATINPLQQEQGDDEVSLNFADEDVIFYPVTRQTLSQLYWKMGAYDLKSDIDIDNFLLINKCSLYSANYDDAFAWEEIRKQARLSLEKNRKNFPRYFEIVVPIQLGKYNIKEKLIYVTPPLNTSRFQVNALDSKKWECRNHYGKSSIWKYPHRTIVTLAQRLDLPWFNVEYDKVVDYDYMYFDYEDEGQRPAYVVMKLKVFDAQPVVERSGYKDKADISAVLEGIEIYADQGRTLRLYAMDMRTKKQIKPEENED